MDITYFTKSRSPKGTRASRELEEMHRSARSTSYIYSSSTRFLASCWKASGEGAKSVYLYPNSSSEISPVISTRRFVCLWMARQHRYIPMLARMVVMS